MKRRIVAMVVMGLAACSAPEQTAAPPASGVEGWVTPPMIDAVARDADGLTVEGRAAPQGRVVLRGAGDVAYAVGADEAGRFEIRILPPRVDTLFVVETQSGQDAVPAPFRMLVSRHSKGPIALIAPGSPTRRLDSRVGLDVVDSDGQAWIASGRGAPGAPIVVAVDDVAVPGVRSGPDGRWTTSLPIGGDAEITVGEQRYDYPGGTAASDLTLAAAGEGWRFGWRLSPTASHESWFPGPGR